MKKYRHKRTGNIYVVVGDCMMKVQLDDAVEAGGAQAWVGGVIYRRDDDDHPVFVRPAESFFNAFEALGP